MALLRGRFVNGVFEPAAPFDLYTEPPDLFTSPAPGTIALACASRVQYGARLVPGGWKDGTVEEIRFRVQRTENGRLRATCSDGDIQVDGDDVAELRDRLDRIVEVRFGGHRRVILVIGREGNA